MPRRNVRFVPVLAVLPALLLAGCATDGAEATAPPAQEPVVEVAQPSAHAVVLGSADPAELALTTSQTFFVSAPVAILAPADDDDARAVAAALAPQITAPVLLEGGGIAAEGVRGEVDRLGAQTLVVVAEDGAVVDPDLSVAGDAEVVVFDRDALRDGSEHLDERDVDDLRAQLPDAGTPELLTEVLLLTDAAPGQEAALATARAAGAVPLEVPGGDPGASADVVRAVSDAKALSVVGLGPSFGDAATFSWRVAAAEGGELLPTGTQSLLPARYVTTSYEVPLTKAGAAAAKPDAVVVEAADHATAYAQEGVLVVPTVQVRATRTTTEAGSDGDHAVRTPVTALRPLVDAAAAAGQYVLLDVEPGSLPLVDQVEVYAELLALPNVGVAVHPEARRAGSGVTRGGRVDVAEVQAVVDLLSGTARAQGLPQKMLVVHQSQTGTVVDGDTLVVPAEVAVVVAADRGGSSATPERVWEAVQADAPAGAALGWAGARSPGRDAAERLPQDPQPVLVATS